MLGSCSYGREWFVPMSSGAGSEWFPTFGESWQVVHVPLITGLLRASFKPPTLVIESGCVLKISSPRAIAVRAAVYLLLSELVRFSHGRKMVKAAGSNAAPVGFPPSGSLIPGKKG